MNTTLAEKTPPVPQAPFKEDDAVIQFSALGLPDDICAMVKGLGYEAPTPIQVRGIPAILSGRDLIGQAQTGTGKTATFALPLLSKIDFNQREPQVLVLTPTRELAIQVAEAFQTYARNNESFHVLPIYGGQPIGHQLRQLNRKPQVIVGTPGRVMDHLRRESLSLTSLKALVIDEADEMLSMGFLEDMEWIITHTPPEKQTVLFSATMPKPIQRIAHAHLRDPQEIFIPRVASEAALIDQSYWMVSGFHKLDALTRILEMNDFDAMLIFVRTKTATVELAERLEARGYAVGSLNGDMTQEARERTVDKLKQRRLDIVVATDVAARGLDVDRITHVINYDIPFDAETYTHRIGRTGRAGRSGTAVLFVSDRETGLLRIIERGMQRRLDKYAMPSREDISRRRTDILKEKITTAMSQNRDLAKYVEAVESIVSETGTSEKNVAAVLCSMLDQQQTPARGENTKERSARTDDRQKKPERRTERPEFTARPPRERTEWRERSAQPPRERTELRDPDAPAAKATPPRERSEWRERAAKDAHDRPDKKKFGRGPGSNGKPAWQKKSKGPKPKH